MRFNYHVCECAPRFTYLVIHFETSIDIVSQFGINYYFQTKVVIYF